MFWANNRLGIEFLDIQMEIFLPRSYFYILWQLKEVIACVFGKLNLKKWMEFCLVTTPTPNPTLPPRLRTEKHIYFQ